MILTLLTEAEDEEEIWIDCPIDENAIVGYWIIQKLEYEEFGLYTDSDEMNIILANNIMTVKVNIKLMEFMDKKMG